MSMKKITGWIKWTTLAGVLALTGGCASVDDRDPGDPLEPFNRAMYRFNDSLDRAVIKPLATGYRAIVPTPVNHGVTNFFENLSDLTSAVNNVLQFKLQRAGADAGRVLVNSTLGVGGIFDVATRMNIPKYEEDFGQTLGYWGMSPGPYIVLPVFGPRSGRDTAGLVVDWYTDPVGYLNPWQWESGLKILRLIDTRADALGAVDLMQKASLDPYEFTKESYLQKRQYEVFDGAPPSEAEAPAQEAPKE